ncbi:MAG: hypothetical protein JWM41_2490 [Gemmatimonadetes bacterium]|nr:hypothetical protein [Gemmatimonadota bacterium]
MKHSRLSRLISVLAVAASIVAAAPVAAGAQRPDSVRPPPPPAPVYNPASIDSFKPPVTPGRAFLSSFLLPGYGQTLLGRHKAGTAFILVEAISLGMIRESAADVHEARRLAGDSLILSYVAPDGSPVVTKTNRRFSDKEIQTREAHVEDWIALLVANHLFSGADAFVAAHLWDVPARLAVRMLPRGGAVVSASMRW